jgi:hypothetical protein
MLYLLLLLARYVFYNWAVVVQWVVAVDMKLGAVSSVYVRLVVEILVDTEYMCFVALPFVHFSLHHGLALMTESPPSYVCALTSLLVPTIVRSGFMLFDCGVI